jgi:hypothetical protein
MYVWKGGGVISLGYTITLTLSLKGEGIDGEALATCQDY